MIMGCSWCGGNYFTLVDGNAALNPKPKRSLLLSSSRKDSFFYLRFFPKGILSFKPYLPPCPLSLSCLIPPTPLAPFLLLLTLRIDQTLAASLHAEKFPSPDGHFFFTQTEVTRRPLNHILPPARAATHFY
ncbi:hypothetical protein H6P81_009203 [Aristolochia fimbriata]|uniref:Uncharacterized protein n=1 Tax=Aristolochia fimbriata TaxID=158543 RepID=A0AAV7EPQ8_ARIFI|nr:hypothetical protein H6P81_009203 [Aristolochia fimbriata]